MKLSTFVADNAEAALAQIEQELGADAVVINVRRLPAAGISRLWNHHQRIEVVAGVPEASPAAQRHPLPAGPGVYTPFHENEEPFPAAKAREPRAWHSVAWLESLGLLPEFADHIEGQLRLTQGATPPESPIDEWHAVRSVLAEFWHAPPHPEMRSGRPHVFIGPPGSGKTTAMCKWMTRAVLAEDLQVRAWRLDGNVANASEFFTLHCEMIGVQVDRFWSPPEFPADFLFVDMPGTDPKDAHALTTLRDQLALLPNPHVHLVLNAAYESPILFEQFHAFAGFAPEDLIFTHLDEERHRVKLWNFVLGTNCSLSFLSGGQKIPGEFRRVESDLLFPCHKTL